MQRYVYRLWLAQLSFFRLPRTITTFLPFCCAVSSPFARCFVKWVSLEKSVALLHNFICLLNLILHRKSWVLSAYQCEICLEILFQYVGFRVNWHISFAHKLYGGLAWCGKKWNCYTVYNADYANCLLNFNKLSLYVCYISNLYAHPTHPHLHISVFMWDVEYGRLKFSTESRSSK